MPRRLAQRRWYTAHRSRTPKQWQLRFASETQPPGQVRLPHVMQSGGLIAAVADAEIFSAQRDLATCEGIFCEPASAASLAVLCQCIRDGRVEQGLRAVCVLTGNGLKDLAAVQDALKPPLSVAPDPASLARVLGL